MWILFHRHSYDVEETWLKSIPYKKKTPRIQQESKRWKGKSELGVHGQSWFDTVELGAPMHGATMEHSQNFMEDKINLTSNSCDPRPEVDPQRDVSHEHQCCSKTGLQEIKQDQASVATLGSSNSHNHGLGRVQLRLLSPPGSRKQEWLTPLSEFLRCSDTKRKVLDFLTVLSGGVGQK